MAVEIDKVEFDADELVALAVEQSGLSDFGSLPYREGLEALLTTYDRHLMDPAGRAFCGDRVVRLLATRLRLEESFKQIPEFEQQKITAPIFVTGLPRSGTSALLNFLAMAPENRSVLYWETYFPDPWPGSKPGVEDPRYASLAEDLTFWQDSEFQKIHYTDTDTPEECVTLHAFTLGGVQLGFEMMLEPYRSWLLAQDLEPLYAYQLKQLQMLNWRNPGLRWVLKAPAHMWGIDAILKVFPDARFIWCHRSPQHVVPSMNSMNQQVMGMCAGDCSHLDPHALGRSLMEWYAQSLERGLQQRAKLPEELFVDCSQQEIVERPMEIVERVYNTLGLPLTTEARAALQAHVNNNPKNKHGKHEYDLSAYGLTEAIIEQRFDFYSRDQRWPLSA